MRCEEPVTPELFVDTDQMNLDQSVDLVLNMLHERGVILEKKA